MDDVDRALQMLDTGVSPTIADLERAADGLRRDGLPRSYAEAAARWRIVVRLEQLGRMGETGSAVA
jgi:hypothetical protein